MKVLFFTIPNFEHMFSHRAQRTVYLPQRTNAKETYAQRKQIRNREKTASALATSTTTTYWQKWDQSIDNNAPYYRTLSAKHFSCPIFCVRLFAPNGSIKRLRFVFGSLFDGAIVTHYSKLVRNWKSSYCNFVLCISTKTEKLALPFDFVASTESHSDPNGEMKYTQARNSSGFSTGDHKTKLFC